MIYIDLNQQATFPKTITRDLNAIRRAVKVLLVKEACHSVNNICEMYFTGFHLFGEYLNRYQEVEKKGIYLEWERTTEDNPKGK